MDTQPINNNNQSTNDNISNENFELSKNILQALLEIILALNNDNMPIEVRNILEGDNDDLDVDPHLSFNIIKALDAIAVSIRLKQQNSTEGQTGGEANQ